MYKYCNQCGHQAAQDARFCARCGSRMEDIANTYETHGEEGQTETNGEEGNSQTEEDGFKEYSTSTAQQLKDSFALDSIDKITASCKVYNIEVTAADVDEIVVSWEQTDTWSMMPQTRGRTLHLKERYRLGMHNIHDFFHNSGHNVIKVEVPKCKAYALGLENETGSITVSNMELSDQVELKTSVGRIEVQNLKTPEALLVSTGTGSIHVSSVDSGQTVRLTSQIGKIQADNIKTTTFFSNSTSGRCSLNDVLASGQFTATGGVGELLLNQITAEKMDIRVNASGNINCQNLYADSDISIYNTVGNISCGICDDVANYTTHCHSDQGSNNYPEISGKGSKRLNVRTTLGSVDIFFTGTKEEKNKKDE